MKRLTLILAGFFLAANSYGADFFDAHGFIDSNRLGDLFSREMGRFETENQCQPREAHTRQLDAGGTRALEIPAVVVSETPLAAYELYRRMAPSVVGVGTTYLCGRCDNLHARLAGGVVIRADGYILTNHHVLEFKEGDLALGVVTFDGRVFPVQEILASNKREDVALLKVDAEGLTAAPLAEGVEVGEGVVAITHPKMNYFVLTEGVVSSKKYLRTPLGKIRQLAITADYAKGSSGCPIFNRRGEVVGLVRATDSVLAKPDDPKNNSLQMVWKYCVPYTAIHDLLRPPAEGPEKGPDTDDPSPEHDGEALAGAE